MPRIAFPTATPNNSVAKKLAPQKIASHAPRHASDSRLLRNYIDTPRRINANNNNMNAV